MSLADKNEIISRFGDASEKVEALLKRVEELAVKLTPDAPEFDEFLSALKEANGFLKLCGFTLVVIIAPEGNGCRLQLAIRDSAPVRTLQ